jgi:GT2 family glycosyltransferase
VSRVDLIIPTHNGARLLQHCLRSLRKSTFADVNVIVMDDASETPVAPLVREEYPAATTLRAPRNLGLAAAFNVAINHGSSEYVVLLNDDTEVEPGWLAQLVACTDRHPAAGSVASKLRLMSDRRLLHSAGDFFSVRGMPGNRGAWLPDYGQFDAETAIFGACGGAALYRRVALETVRLGSGQIFDERLFMYCEDVDLAWRLQARGWSCMFAFQAVVYHHLSATAGGRLASYYVARNAPLVLRRSVPKGVMRPYARRVTAYHLGRSFRALRHSNTVPARAELRGAISGWLEAALDWTPRASLSEPEIKRLRSLLHEPAVPASRD